MCLNQIEQEQKLLSEIVLSQTKDQIDDSKLDNCEACYMGKFRQIVSREPLKSGNIDPLTYFNCGPFKTLGLKGEKYFITLTCRASRAIWLYSLKRKADAYDTLVNFYNMTKNQFSTNIKVFHLDNAGEFRSNKWSNFCKNKGIICNYTSPYTSAQNGIAERLNRFIIERIICLCYDMQIPLKL